MTELNGTIEDEAKILSLCWNNFKYLGAKQVVSSMTTLHNPIFASHHSLGTRKPSSPSPNLSIDPLEGFDPYMPNLLRETVDDFKTKNMEQHPVEPHFTMEGRLHCVPDEELRRIFFEGSGGWDEFRELYPQSHGIISVSRVGFDANLRQALALTGVTVGPRAGGGGYSFWVKTEQDWELSGELGAWIQ